MANRCYLYSTNFIPGTENKEARRITGISEWPVAIPLVYKLLVSQETRPCKSVIWESPDNIALVGDYQKGVKRLETFLQKIIFPEAQPLIQEAMDFLNDARNKNQFFLLEPAEIFQMIDTPMTAQSAKLLEATRLDDDLLNKILHASALIPAKDFGSRIFRARLKIFHPQTHKDISRLTPLQRVTFMGLGNWSNNLYFEPS